MTEKSKRSSKVLSIVFALLPANADGGSECARRDGTVCKEFAADLGPNDYLLNEPMPNRPGCKTHCVPLKDGRRHGTRCFWRCPRTKIPPRVEDKTSERSEGDRQTHIVPLHDPPPRANDETGSRRAPGSETHTFQRPDPKPAPPPERPPPAPTPPASWACPSGYYSVSAESCCPFGMVLSGKHCVWLSPNPATLEIPSAVLVAFWFTIFLIVGGIGVLLQAPQLLAALLRPKKGPVSPVAVAITDIELVAQNMPDIKPETLRSLVLALNGLAAEKRS